MNCYLAHIICDDGEQATVTVYMDENDPADADDLAFQQTVAMAAMEFGLKFASIDTIEFVEDA
jgi:hypothetical protein